jgi:hypothetical protein
VGARTILTAFLVVSVMLWLLALPTAASLEQSVSGGGWITTSSGGRGTFGLFVALHDDGRISGHLVYADHSVGLRLRSTSINGIGTSITCDSTIFGTGDSTFGPVSFVVTVTDDGEPGRGVDTFSIVVVTAGYVQSGVLSAGDIQVHGAVCP